jgi:mono/diheme cytochrome c family protein
LDKKMTKSNTLFLRKCFAVCCLLLSATPFAFAQEGEVSEQQIAMGEEVYNTVAGIGCKSCHGEYAEGDLGVGPFTRGANVGMIRAAVDGIGEMIVIKNTINDEQIAAVSAYLGHLGTAQVARSLVKRGRFLPATFSARPGTRLQVVLQNSGFSAQTFASDNMNIGNMEIPARSSGNMIWEAPDEEGVYSLYCTDCKLQEQFFTINIDSDAPEFRQIAPGIASKGSEAGLYLYE